MSKIIKVLVVDDSLIAREIITEILQSDSDIKVIGTANNGQEAVELVPKLKPDLITMDVYMPVMDGLEATEKIMAYHPTPILVVSAAAKKEMDYVFRAIGAGALDVMEKPAPKSWSELPRVGKELIGKVKMLSKIKVATHLAEKNRARTRKILFSKEEKDGLKVIAMASSTGGPETLRQILSKFPADFPAGIVIAQHITDGFIEGLVKWLNKECQITVKEAKMGDKISPGIAFVAPTGAYMKVREGGRIILDNSLPVAGIRPSANILFSSVAEVYHSRSIGLILTGMGTDGAAGIQAIKNNGGITLAEDEQSCVISSMPKAAVETGAVDKIVPLDSIAEEIMKLL